jgi:hypothetical protein
MMTFVFEMKREEEDGGKLYTQTINSTRHTRSIFPRYDDALVSSEP